MTVCTNRRNAAVAIIMAAVSSFASISAPAQQSTALASTDSALSTLAVETHTETVGGLTWTYMVSDGKAVLGGGRRTVKAIDSSTSGAIEVPSTLGGYPVVSVGNYAFFGCDQLTSVSLPAGLVSVGKDAFSGATALESVVLPEGLATLGSGVFEECWSLVDVNLPSTLSEIPESAFAYCESLEALTIPASVTSVGDSAFLGCDALLNVTFMGPPPDLELSYFFDLDVPPTILCRTAYLADYRGIAVDGQPVFTFDGSGLAPLTESATFGFVGLDTTDAVVAEFENTSAGDVIVTGIGYSGFSAAPVETFSDSSAIDGWTFYPSKSWGVKNGVLNSCLNGTSVDGFRYCMLPDAYSDVTVQADVWLNDDGNHSNALGIFVRADEGFDGESGSGWCFQIAPSGSYFIYRSVDGEFTVVVGWTDSDAINSYDRNTLTVAVHGSEFSFAINGVIVWTGVDDSLPGPGYVGLYNYDGGSGTYLKADNLRVLENFFGAGDEDASNDSFTFSTNFPFTVASGEHFTLPLAFHPVRTGSLCTRIGLVSTIGSSAGVLAFGTGVEDDISLVEASSLAFAGHTGGPFEPDEVEVVLTNSFRFAQSFTVEMPSWLSGSVSSATLDPGAVTTLVFSTSSAACDMPTGRHSGSVVIRHVENGHETSIPCSLNSYVTGTPILPDGLIVVTNRPGQSQSVQVSLGNSAGSDGSLTARLTAAETGRVDVASASVTALKAARKAAGPVRISASAKWAPQRILVRFDRDRLSSSANKVGVSEPDYDAAAMRLCGGRVIRTYKSVPGLVLVELASKAPSASAMESVLQRLEQSDDVVYAEPDYRVKANAVPNDPMYSDLWGMFNDGQTGGTPGADISAEAAWDITTGSREIIVGVIDTGVDYTHPDLAANMWVNPDEIPGNGIDDDGNGFVDDVYGINSIAMDGDPMDDHHHGSHCAGTIGAVGDNGVGVVGVCWKVRIMALKFLDEYGYGGDSDAITCIEYAIEKGAKVLSNSWGGPGYNQAMHDAIEAAKAAGITFVAAAGNESADNDETASYPCGYDCDNIISVVSTDHNDELSYFSNYGAETCDIAAPGSDILSCSPGGGYITLSGTSMATPHVSGAAALLLSLNPSMSPADVKNSLLSTADPIEGLEGTCVTGARMNIAEALKTVSVWAIPSPETVDGIAPGESSEFSLVFDAGSLSSGQYDGFVKATAQDEDGAFDTVPIRMVVLGDDLAVSDSDDLAVTLAEGVDAVDEAISFCFSNNGSSTLNWSLSSSADWLVVSQASGSLSAGGDAAVELNVSGCEALVAGRYEATLTLENATTGARFFRTFVLTVTKGTGPLYIDPVNGDDANHGRLEAYPMRTLQGAMGRVTDGTEVLLPDGVYGPVRYTGSATFTIRGINGCQKTFIDGGGEIRCCTFTDDEYGYWYDTPQGMNVTVVGVTLMNGRASGDGSKSYGGAAYGGSYDSCRMVDSTADGYGGGACYAFLNRCEVRGNASGIYGGGLYYCTAVDSLVCGNSINANSYAYGAGAYYGGLTGCTVAGNSIGDSGSYPGVYYASMTNTIVWANDIRGNANVTQAGYNSSRVNSIITSGDPLFRSPQDGVWTLCADSPALDSGLGSAVVNDVDLLGNQRVQGGAVDIGCYEGVDERPYVAGRVSGTGMLSAPYSYADYDGNATITAVETTRDFLRWEDEDGETIGTELSLTLSGVTSVRRVVAVFAAKEFFVDAEDGDDCNEGTESAAPLKTLSYAISKAETGETITVGPGVYGPVDVGAKKLFVIGSGAGESIIDGGGTNRCATLGTTTNGTVLVGFTLRNGYAEDGGGAYCGRLVACELVGNEAEYGGGAMYSRLESCVVACNTAGSYGSGVYYGYTYNCSVVGNRSRSYDNYCNAAYGGNHYNSAFAGNVSASGVEIDPYNYWNGDNCISGASNCGMADPFHGDARPRTGSPLIDAGYDDYITCDRDFTGTARVQGERVDIGAYEGVHYEGLVASVHVVGHGTVSPETVLLNEGDSVTFTATEDGREFLCFIVDGEEITDSTVTFSDLEEDIEVTAVFASATIYADSSAASDGDGLSVESPVRSLQDAVDIAYDGDVVIVAPGVYEPIYAADKRLDIRAAAGRDVTIIDGGEEERCATLGESMDYCSSLSGFTLRNGFSDYSGGGAYHGVLSNCVLTANSAGGNWESNGGATYGSILYDCIVYGNSVSDYYAYGGASSYGEAYRTVFSNNVATATDTAYGGACYNMYTCDCLFVGNAATGGDSDNSGYGYGGAIAEGSHYNATIARNTASGTEESHGGGISYGYVYNSIVYGNTQTADDEMYDCYEVVSVLTDDPMFVNADAGDFRLSIGSPAIDAGDNDYVYTETDLAGNNRIKNGTVDIGCFEGGVATTLPEQVTGLRAARGYLAWEITPYAESYNVYRSSQNDSSSAALLGTADSTSYVDATVEEGTTCYYWVEAVNELGVGPLSEAAVNTWPEPLVIVTTELPVGRVHEDYSNALEAAGGTAPYAWEAVVPGYGVATNDSEFALVGTAQGWQADDACWYLNLPFAFPFYGSVYNSVYVSSNGTISFGESAVDDYQYSDDVFFDNPMIAVLWSDLSTDESGDVYVTSDESSVTIRWSAKYLSASSDVNVSATLYSDGRIILSYGEGNANGGFCGISAGDGECGQVLANDEGSWANVGDVVLTPGGAFVASTDGLPEGLEVSEDGVITGNAAESGDFTVYFRVTDSMGFSEIAEFSFAVAKNPWTYYVDANTGDDGNDGLSWDSAMCSIQSAIDVAYEDDLICVTNGTYAPISSNNRRIRIESVNGAAATFIDGGGTRRCATLSSKWYDSPYMATNTVLSGFTLCNGRQANTYYVYGGGVFYGMLERCVVSNCMAVASEGNSGYNMAYGGGAYYGVLDNCLIVGNGAESPYLSYGGGTCYSVLRSCTVVGNHASGGETAQGSGEGYGGGVNSGEAFNTIIWDNESDGSYSNAVDASMYYCETSRDPLFVDASAGDYRLQADSPCIDAGHNGYVVVGVDFAGGRRIRGGTVDVGCYEFYDPSAKEETETTPVPVKHSWLDAYPELLAEHGGDYEAMANAQSPGIGGAGKTWPNGESCYVWQDFVAGTSPTNDVVFTATIRMEGDEPIITWEPYTPELQATRTYKTLGATTLENPEWYDVTDVDKTGYKFFKVTVEVQ